MTIEFNYTVSCGLDSYSVQMDELPTPMQAYDIILSHCFKYNIDPYFALSYTAWWNWSGTERKSFKLSDSFRQTMRPTTYTRRYAHQKAKEALKA